jgi:putative oxidoreductase
MDKNSGNLADKAVLFLRIGIGLSFIFFHGGPKIFGGPERWEKVGSAVNYFGIDFFHPFWGLLAAFAEFGGGILLILGIFFRPALSLMLITMFVAAWQHLAKGDGILRAAYPIEMGIVLISLFIAGPGIYSLQEYIKRKK